MGFLTDIPDNTLKMSGYTFVINPAFDVVLEVQKLFQEEIPETLKVMQALDMFISNGKWNLRKLTDSEKNELLDEIYKKFIHTKRKSNKKSTNLLDFEEDGEYIYSSFMYDYNIDLVDQQGKLSWKKFLALFQGLSDKTKIREVMKIRQMELPQPNGKNAKQIQEIMELKSYYALPVKGGGGDKGLDQLWSTLENMAEGGAADG